MSRTLNLVEQLLAMGRKYQELGLRLEALRVLNKLTGFRELPAQVAEEVQARLGEIQIKRRKFQRARRHLTIVLRHRPDEARYQYLMAVACLAEGRGDLERAHEHFRHSLALDGGQVDCLMEAGLLSIRLGRTDQGLAWLRQAVDCAPDDAGVVGKLVKGLRQSGKAEEAQRAAGRAFPQRTVAAVSPPVA